MLKDRMDSGKFFNMINNATDKYHFLFGNKKTRMSFNDDDFLDYLIMIVLCVSIIFGIYGLANPVSVIGAIICIIMPLLFIVRHGVKIKIPIIVKNPQEFVFTLIYKITNLRKMFFIAGGVLVAENYLIYLTPELPHNVELMRSVAFFLFYLHLIIITAYRTAIFIAHIIKREKIRSFLMETSWKRSARSNEMVLLNIFHAYFTGLLTHIILVAPWFLVISYSNFSLIFMPVTIVVNIYVAKRFLEVLNDWFYRDHWIGHNSEFEFVYIHGSHHDAIPSGLIAVAGNGFIEGFLRNIIAFPNPFYNPITAFFIYTVEIKKDIDAHQFIPGVYPKPSAEFQSINQHSIHHLGKLEPYGFALRLNQKETSEKLKKRFQKFPDSLMNSYRIDEEMTGFNWDNSSHKKYMKIFDKYR